MKQLFSSRGHNRHKSIIVAEEKVAHHTGGEGSTAEQRKVHTQYETS